MSDFVRKWKGDYSDLRGSLTRMIKAMNRKKRRKYPKQKKYIIN